MLFKCVSWNCPYSLLDVKVNFAFNFESITILGTQLCVGIIGGYKDGEQQQMPGMASSPCAWG